MQLSRLMLARQSDPSPFEVEGRTSPADQRLFVNYKFVVQNLPKLKASSVFPSKLLMNFRVKHDEDITVIEGCDLNPVLLGFNSPVSICKNFRMFLVQNLDKKKPFRRII